MLHLRCMHAEPHRAAEGACQLKCAPAVTSSDDLPDNLGRTDGGAHASAGACSSQATSGAEPGTQQCHGTVPMSTETSPSQLSLPKDERAQNSCLQQQQSTLLSSMRPDRVEHERARTSDYRFVYVGLKGSRTLLHADVLRSHSWSVNVAGTKSCDLHPSLADVSALGRFQ